MKKFILKLTLLSVVGFSIMGCETPIEKWDQKFTVGDGTGETIEGIVKEFGEPIKKIDYSNYLEVHDTTHFEFNDRFNPGISNEELVGLLEIWNELSEQNFNRLNNLGLYKNIPGYVPKYIKYWEWMGDKRFTLEMVKSEEFDFLEKNLPVTKYKEKVSDRKNRLKEINNKIDLMFWEPDFYWLDEEYKSSNQHRYHFMINEEKVKGLNLMIPKPKQPSYQQEWTFDLGKGEYGDYYTEKKEQKYPEDLEVSFKGYLKIGWEGGLSGYSGLEFENPVSFCDCMTKGGDYSTPGTFTYKFCQDRFIERYGVENPDLDNFIVKRDYERCKGN